LSTLPENEPMNKLSEKVREIAALLLLGLALFAFLSTISFTGSSALSPDENSQNLCGHTGHKLSTMMLHNFGYACYALYACIVVWGIILFLRKTIKSVISKAFGLLAFTLFASGLLSHFFSGSPSYMPDHGGLVGFQINHFFVNSLGLGEVGASITLVILAMITFLLATDWLYFSSLSALIEWISEKRTKWLERKAQQVKKIKKPAKPVKKKLIPELPLPEEPQKQLLLSGDTEDKEEKNPRAIKALLNKITGKSTSTDKDKTDDQSAANTDEAIQATTAEQQNGDTISYSPPPVTEIKDYQNPELELLDDKEHIPKANLKQMIAEISQRLENTLKSFKIEAEVVEIQRGPVITMYEMALAKGIKVDRIRALEDDIAMAVKAQSVRIVAPIPGKSTFGIEVPNNIREVVRLKELLSSSDLDADNYALPICLGKDAAGKHLVEDLAKMPHLLVAGATGAGKSVCLNSIIMSILYTRNPDQTKMILVDPKMVELSSFKAIPHLMCPVVTDMKRASAILEWAVKLMDARYQLLSDAGVKNIYGYNELGETKLRERLGRFLDEEKFSPIMPFIVIIVDELADLMMIAAKDVESFITRLAQKSRAVGIHLILATQRPSTNVITGLIKANMPTRIAFMVASKIDSRVILDTNGAEKLLGQGDMLYLPPRSSVLSRAQGAYVAESEIRKVVKFLKKKGNPEFEEDLIGKKRDDAFDPWSIDDLYEEATTFMIETQRGSASLLQRRFSIGYTRASRLIDLMAQHGILGEYKGSQAREVLFTMEDWEKLVAERRAKQR